MSNLYHSAFVKSTEDLVLQIAAKDPVSVADALVSESLIEPSTKDEVNLAGKTIENKARLLVADVFRKVKADEGTEKLETFKMVLERKGLHKAVEILDKNIQGKTHDLEKKWLVEYTLLKNESYQYNIILHLPQSYLFSSSYRVS